MRRNAWLTVPTALAEKLNGLCAQAPEEDLGENGVLFEEEIPFTNGMVVEVQICPAGTSPAWSQAVLYSPASSGLFEISCSEVGDSLTGEYHIFDGDDEYSIKVISGDCSKPFFRLFTEEPAYETEGED